MSDYNVTSDSESDSDMSIESIPQVPVPIDVDTGSEGTNETTDSSYVPEEGSTADTNESYESIDLDETEIHDLQNYYDDEIEMNIVQQIEYDESQMGLQFLNDQCEYCGVNCGSEIFYKYCTGDVQIDQQTVNQLYHHLQSCKGTQDLP